MSEALQDRSGITGTVTWEVRDTDGNIKRHGESRNLVTQTGDQVYGERGAGVAGALAAPVGMKLGTGSTAAAKTGAGAALVTYLSGSNQVFDSTYPSSALNGAARRITYKVTYAAGTATTATPITEVVLFNDANANATSTAANTTSRSIISPGAKAAGDILTVTWTQDLTGS